MQKDYILAIDQGTTSSRAIIFDRDLKPLTTAQAEFTQHFPQSGWVEHDPEDLWSTTIDMCQQALKTGAISASTIAAIGITNQRETTLVWDKHTGKAIYPAIVWQDRRTADYCRDLKAAGHEDMVAGKTGLLLDPYFSATKLHWILTHVDGAMARAKAGDLLFGTVDSYIIWRLTGRAAHVTDATNAARTMLYNIAEGCWDQELLDLFDIPAHMLPEVKDSSGHFGTTHDDLFDGAAIPILGVAGDQQAATVGQACFQPGMIKSTYGTGCFALMNTGDKIVYSSNRLLTTIAYQLDGKPTYALEGSIFIAGAVVQWLRDGLKIIASASETQALAESASDTEQVYLVPAFTGLGAPYWNADCRGAIFGLTRNTGPAEIAKAALESVAYQTRDLTEAMSADWDNKGKMVLRIDGGMVANNWAMQMLSNQLGAPVDRPVITETTALGAAYLAGLAAGICAPPDEFAASWKLEKRFEPNVDCGNSDTLYAGWKQAVARLLHDPES
ncbi:glycerol kinase GlpK [Candidatus Puniceispirillum sp.]|uniref:glycerol kinase GlpK n=1 Tax=Candidatus Puniceispirillum sp. TaxID=2026719 RepID=UPI003F696C34